MTQINTEDEIEQAVDVGDEIAWAESWTSGEKTFRAVVVGTRTKRLGGALTGNKRDILSFELDIIEGDASAFTAETPQMNVEELADVDNFEVCE